MSDKIDSTLVRELAQLSKKLLFAGTCLLAGCTGISGVGDGAAGKPSVEIAFTADPDDPLFARAKTSEGIEFAVFVERSVDRQPVRLQEFDTKLADGTIVTAMADDLGRPVRFEDGRASVTILYRTSDAAVVYRDETGTTFETKVSLPLSDPAAAKPIAVFQTSGTELLCGGLLADYLDVVAVVFACLDPSDSPLCGSSIAAAALASLTLCSADASIVEEEQLQTTIQTDRETLSVPLVPSVVAVANMLAGTGEVIVELNAVASGGVAPHTIKWEITDGPMRPAVPQGSATQVTLDQTGTYTIVVTATDSNGGSAVATIVVDIVVESLTAPLSANAGPDKTTTEGDSVILEGSAAGGDGNFSYQWSPATGLSDPTVPQPALNTTSVGTGVFEYTLTVMDGTGAVASDTVTVTINSPPPPPVALPPATVINSIQWGADFTGAGYQVLVEFSQPMNQFSAETLANYRINGTATNPTSATLGGGGRTVTLVFGVPMRTTERLDVSVGGSILDAFGRTILETLNQAIAANAGDTTVPTISSVNWAANFTGNGYQLTAVFNEAMDETTAETLTNYRINGTAVNPTGATLGTDGKTVTLTFTTLVLDTANTLDVSLAAAITDINAQARPQVLAQVIAANAGDTTVPTISQVRWANGFTGNGYQLTAVFNEAMDETTAETLTNYRINGTAVNPTSAALGTDGKTVTLTFTTLALGTANTLDVSLAAAVTDINAQAKTEALAQAIAANAGDTAAPTIASVTYGSEATNYIAIITFNESVDETTAETVGNYDINNGDDAGPNSAVLATDGKTVTLTWTAAELTQPWAIADTMDISIGNTITDINAQALVLAAGTALAANGADVAGPADPTVNHAALAVTVDLLFDEVMDEATTEVGTFTVTGGTPPTQVGVAVLADDGRTLTVTFTANPTGRNIVIPSTLLDINGQAYAGGTLAIPN